MWELRGMDEMAGAVRRRRWVLGCVKEMDGVRRGGFQWVWELCGIVETAGQYGGCAAGVWGAWMR